MNLRKCSEGGGEREGAKIMKWNKCYEKARITVFSPPLLSPLPSAILCCVGPSVQLCKLSWSPKMPDSDVSDFWELTSRFPSPIADVCLSVCLSVSLPVFLSFRTEEWKGSEDTSQWDLTVYAPSKVGYIVSVRERSWWWWNVEFRVRFGRCGRNNKRDGPSVILTGSL